MDVRLIHDPNTWEHFVRTQPNTLFVQSSHYGEFYRAMGEQYWMLGIYDGERLLGGSLVLSTHAKRGNFLYLPYGPVFGETGDHGAMLHAFTERLKELGKREGMHFIRMSPFWEDTAEQRSMLVQGGFQRAPIHVLAETTWMLDISPSEEEILAAMNKNHRNLVRRCAKEGVRVVMHDDAAALTDMNDLLDITTERHKFHRFSRTYIEHEFAAFRPHDETLVIHAYLPDGTLDASAVVMFYGTMACYRHGASRGADKHLPTSYAIQWAAIQEAKRRGMRWYNFWGIAPEGAKKTHPFFGITHFKKGFGGAMFPLVPCHDLPLSWRYYPTRYIETVRRMKRGF